jgi:hypothetical protein
LQHRDCGGNFRSDQGRNRLSLSLPGCPPKLTERSLQLLLAIIPHYRQRHFRARRRARNTISQCIVIAHWLTVKGRNHIALPETCAIRRAARLRMPNDSATGFHKTNPPRDVRGHRPNNDA